MITWMWDTWPFLIPWSLMLTHKMHGSGGGGWGVGRIYILIVIAIYGVLARRLA